MRLLGHRQSLTESLDYCFGYMGNPKRREIDEYYSGGKESLKVAFLQWEQLLTKRKGFKAIRKKDNILWWRTIHNHTGSCWMKPIHRCSKGPASFGSCPCPICTVSTARTCTKDTLTISLRFPCEYLLRMFLNFPFHDSYSLFFERLYFSLSMQPK